jgi:hypothetical protein
MNTAPVVSSADLIVPFVALCIGVLVLLVLLYAAQRLRLAALGEALLEANAGDWDAAAKAVDSTRLENQRFAASAYGDDADGSELLADVRHAEFRKRQARFNADCQ